MRNMIYFMNVSLDGFVEGPDGKFGWSRPDEEVHRFHNRMAPDMGAFLYGRRMYETMAGWQNIDENPSAPDHVVEFRASTSASAARVLLRHSFDLGLIDEYRLVVYPIMVGGGKSYFPARDIALTLRLLESRAFGCGAVYLHYQRA